MRTFILTPVWVVVLALVAGCQCKAPPGAGVTDSGCVTATCASESKNCGALPDGCGATLDCGSCPAGQTCGGGGANVCGQGSCTPGTCATLGMNCGTVSDGCASVLDCGSCLL